MGLLDGLAGILGGTGLGYAGQGATAGGLQGALSVLGQQNLDKNRALEQQKIANALALGTRQNELSERGQDLGLYHDLTTMLSNADWVADERKSNPLHLAAVHATHRALAAKLGLPDFPDQTQLPPKPTQAAPPSQAAPTAASDTSPVPNAGGMGTPYDLGNGYSLSLPASLGDSSAQLPPGVSGPQPPAGSIRGPGGTVIPSQQGPLSGLFRPAALPPGVAGPPAPPGSVATPFGTILPAQQAPSSPASDTGGAASADTGAGTSAQETGPAGAINSLGDLINVLHGLQGSAFTPNPAAIQDRVKELMEQGYRLQTATKVASEEAQAAAQSIQAQVAAALAGPQITDANAGALGKLAEAAYSLQRPGLARAQLLFDLNKFLQEDQTTRRGQDKTADTARLGQVRTAATEVRGQNVTMRGQDATFTTAGNRLAFDKTKEELDNQLKRSGLRIQAGAAGLKLTELTQGAIRGDTQEKRAQIQALRAQMQRDLDLAYAASPLKIPGASNRFVFTPWGTLGGKEWDQVRADAEKLRQAETAVGQYTPRSPQETAALNARVSPAETSDVKGLITQGKFGQAYQAWQGQDPVRAQRMLRIFHGMKGQNADPTKF